MGKKVKKTKKLKWWHVALAVVTLVVLTSAGKDNTSENSPTPEPTAAMTQTPEPTNTPTPLPTNTPIPTNTSTPTPTVTNTPTNTPVPTNTPTPKPTNTPKPTATPTPDTSVLLDKIIGNANTNKYHTTNCGRLPNEENRVYFDTVEEAEAQGMVECGYCKKKRK